MMRPVLTALLFSVLASVAAAHCQIPCGIYGDDTRFKTLEEHFTTLEKSMKMILELQGESPVNYNQLVRWVSNKEKHADEVQEIVQQYFLAQRVKLPEKDADKGKYYRMLERLHALIVHAMKAKQTTDTGHVAALRKHLHEFWHLYSPKK